MAKVCQLFSGSSGNSIFVSSMGKNILIDIGVTAKRCDEALRKIGVEPESIDAILVTHEHNDHSKGLRVFASKHKVPVFASQPCIDKLYEYNLVNEKNTLIPLDYHMEIGGIEVMSFMQSHDSVDCRGYRLNLPEGRSVAVCTDTGYVTENAKQVLSGTDLIFIESNHETSMVQTGPYPYHLKKRILSEIGHLSNFACSEYIKELAQSGTTRFILSHLSRENNMPEIARQTAVSALSEIGLNCDRDYRLYVSPTENNSGGIAL